MKSFTTKALKMVVLSILIAPSVQAHDTEQEVNESGKQLCYVAKNDIGAYNWLKRASLFYSSLERVSKNGDDACWELNSEAKALEARMLVAMDATRTTLVIK